MTGTDCNPRCRSAVPSAPTRTFEPMFASRKTLAARMADAMDLAIDFATLGEYGLEPVEERPCERRARARRDLPVAASARAERLASSRA